MEENIINEVENIIEQISPKEKVKNRILGRKIAFLKKFLGHWHDEQDFDHKSKRNPNPFYMCKEKLDA